MRDPALRAMAAVAACLVAAACGGAVHEAAKRDLELATEKRALAMAENPNRREQFGIELNLKQARKAFDAGDFEEASELASIARQFAEDALAARLGKRDEVASRIALIRQQVEGLQDTNDPRIDLAKLLAEVGREAEAATRALAGKDYDAGLASSQQALDLIDRRFVLFLLPSPSSFPETSTEEAGTGSAEQGSPPRAKQDAEGRSGGAKGKPTVWDQVKGFIMGEEPRPSEPK